MNTAPQSQPTQLHHIALKNYWPEKDELGFTVLGIQPSTEEFSREIERNPQLRTLVKTMDKPNLGFFTIKFTTTSGIAEALDEAVALAVAETRSRTAETERKKKTAMTIFAKSQGMVIN